MLNLLSQIQLFVTLWTIALEAPLSLGILQARILEWVSCPSPGDLLNAGTEFVSLMSPTLAGGFFTSSTTCGEGNGTQLQYSCLENPMGRGAWWAAVHGIAKSQTRVSNFTFTFHFHALEKEMASHSSVLAWRIPGTGEPGGLPCMGLHRVVQDWSDLLAAAPLGSPPCQSTWLYSEYHLM